MSKYNPIKIWRPAAFQGTGQKAPYFEGWFFKLVDATSKHVYAVIPGIHLAPSPSESHAFIQILDGQTHRSSYHRFPLESFQAASRQLEIRIGNNYFNNNFLELDISADGREINGKVEFQNLNPWPVRLTAPGIMGWYAFLPFMECYHGVLSFDHILNGSLRVNGNPVNFDGGRGYIEKDWGKSFPSAYVWLQSNHFEDPGVSLMTSVAQIPWLSGAFRGFLAGFLLNEKLYQLTTYSGAELHYLEITDQQVRLAISDKKCILKIEAERVDGAVLHAPYENQMLKRVSETLAARIAVEFFEIKNGESQLVFKGTGNAAGLDVNGRLEEIVSSEKKSK